MCSDNKGAVGRQQVFVHEKSRRSGFFRLLMRPRGFEPPPRNCRTRPSTWRVYQFRHRRVARGESSRRPRPCSRELRLAARLLSALLAALLRGRVTRAGVRVRDLRRAFLRHALLAQTLVLLVVLDRRTVIFSHADPIPGAESASTLGVAGQTVAGAGRNPRSRKVRTP